MVWVLVAWRLEELPVLSAGCLHREPRLGLFRQVSFRRKWMYSVFVGEERPSFWFLTSIVMC